MTATVNPYERAIEELILEKSFYEFVKAAWHVLEPGVDYVDNWHIATICDHLEAVHRGEIKRLLINIPPRCMKSLLVSVFYPAWKWAIDPSHQFMSVTHSAKFASRDTVKMRDLVTSKWFQERWPHVKLAKETETEFRNTQNGHRYGFGVSAKLTGVGCDTLIVDDLHDADDARSQTKIKAGVDSFRKKLSTRLNDRRTGSIIVIMQRLAENDVCGWLLGEIEDDPPSEDYDALILPMEYDEEIERTTTLGVCDERTEKGELLWKLKFPREDVDALRLTLGTYGASAQLDQQPAPAEGAMMVQRYFKEYTSGEGNFYDENGKPYPINSLRRFGAADLAYKKNQRSDYNVLGAAAGDMESGKLFIYGWHRQKVNIRDMGDDGGGKHEGMITRFRKQYSLPSLGVESGFLATEVIQNLKKRGEPIVGVKADKDKDLRFYDAEPQLELELLYIPTGEPWTKSMLRECLKYPTAAHDDQFDVIVYLVLEWMRIRQTKTKIEKRRIRGVH